MERTYSYIEVLLSLREEYLKNELELKKLKDLTELHDEKVVDYYFRCVNSVTNKLLLDREVIKSKIKKIIGRFSGEIDLSVISECIKDETGNYIIKGGDYNTPFILNQNDFNEQADKILESDFVKNITKRSIPVSNGFVHFTASSIFLFIKNYEETCRYQSYGDILQIQATSKVDDSELYRLLNTSIPVDKLNDWQREIVDRNYEKIEDITFLRDDKDCRKTDLHIRKENNKVYLKKM